jgi:NitT/TauT family transport system substrate-binding protein
MRTNSRRSLTGITLALGVAMVAAACSGGTAAEGDATTDAAEDATTADAETDGAPEVTDLTVGIVPVVDHASVFIANQEGFFEEEGLTVEPTAMQGGAAALPAMISGDLQAAFASYPSFFLAEQQGLGVTIVAEGIRGNEETAGIYVPADSPIQEPKDLEGATVAVNTLNNIGDVTVSEVVEQAGGNAEDISFVEMAFPDMPAQLTGGQVDAIWVLEPFRTMAIEAGAEVVSHNFAAVDPDMMVAAYFTTQQVVQSDPELVEAFTAAMSESLDFAEANPEKTRAILSTYTELDPAVQEAMVMPRFDSEINTESVQLLADLALKYGLVDEAVDLDALLP